MRNETLAQDYPTVREARDRLQTDLKALVRDAEDLLKATSADASAAVKTARDRLASGLERTKASYLEWQDDRLESARAGLKRADATVRSHPYETVGLAFGIGLLTGMLLRRR